MCINKKRKNAVLLHAKSVNVGAIVWSNKAHVRALLFNDKKLKE